MRKRATTAITTALFVISLPLLLLAASIWGAATSHWLYTSGFERNAVAGATGLSRAELDSLARSLIGYFKNGDEYVQVRLEPGGPPVDFFTPEELVHFRDVKRLFRLDFRVMVATATYVAGYAAFHLWRRDPRERRTLARHTLAGSGLTLGLLGLLGITAALDFNWLFLQFHYLAFSNEYWAAEGRMLELFPGAFWYDTVIRLLVAVAGAAALAGGGAGAYLWRARRRENRGR